MNKSTFRAMIVLGTIGAIGPAIPALLHGQDGLSAVAIGAAALALMISAVVASSPLRSPIFWLSPAIGAWVAMTATPADASQVALLWSMAPIGAYLARVGLDELWAMPATHETASRPAAHPGGGQWSGRVVPKSRRPADSDGNASAALWMSPNSGTSSSKGSSHSCSDSDAGGGGSDGGSCGGGD